MEPEDAAVFTGAHQLYVKRTEKIACGLFEQVFLVYCKDALIKRSFFSEFYIADFYIVYLESFSHFNTLPSLSSARNAVLLVYLSVFHDKADIFCAQIAHIF